MSKRIDVDDEPPRRRRPPTEPSNDRIAYILGAVLIVFGLLTGAVAFTMVRSHTFNPLVGVVSYFVPSPESLFGKERVYVALYGLDYDYNNQDNPTVLARIGHEDLENLFRGYGYVPYFVEGSDYESMHQAMAGTLQHCIVPVVG